MFYKTVCALCAEKGEKLTPVVMSLGFSKGNITKWKNGSLPTVEILCNLAEYFGVTTDYLLTGETPPAPPSLTDDEKAMLGYYARLDGDNKVLIKGKMVELYKEQSPNEV